MEEEEENKSESPLGKEKEKTIVNQIDSEFTLSLEHTQSKRTESLKRLKLYNNQKRDKSAVGDPLLFTVFNTVLAELYVDRLSSVAQGAEEGDDEAADSLTAMMEFDHGLMEKDEIDYEWDWDTAFFGRGFLLLNEFDRDKNVPVSEIIDPMIMIRDPRATSMNGNQKGNGKARFWGREIGLSKSEMKANGNYFNLDDVKKDKDDKSMSDEARSARREAQGKEDTKYKEEALDENYEYQLLEWWTHIDGKKYIITLANNRKLIVRYKELKEDKWPVIDRVIFPMAHEWDGVSIPDLIEDKQRARSVMINLGMESAKADLYPMYLFNKKKIDVEQNLDFEFNKMIPINGDVTNAMTPIQKSVFHQQVNLILNILDTAAQKCYSEDTQTLTDKGWKYYWEIKKDEKIATFNPNTEKIEYHKPSKTYVYDYKGKMFHYKKDDSVDLLVTPNHKIFYRSADFKKLKNGNEWKLEKAKDIKLKNIEFLISGDWEGKEQKEVVLKEIKYSQQIQHNKGDIKIKMDDWLEFLGYIISEGGISSYGIKKNKYGVNIAQKKGENADKIRECLNRLPFKINERVDKNGYLHWDINNKTLVLWLIENSGSHCYLKHIPREYLSLPKRQLKILFDAYMLGDGHIDLRKNRESGRAQSVSRQLIDDLQELSIKLGYKTKIVEVIPSKETHLPAWSISFAFNNNRNTPEIRVEKNLDIEDYDGIVFCFEVPNHLFVTRRNGLVSIQGNSVAAPEVSQGVTPGQNRTLGETELVMAGKNVRHSLSAKIWGWSERRFWQQWYQIYKRDFKDSIGKKMLRIQGPLNVVWRELTKENFITEIDPDFFIESQEQVEMERQVKFRDFSAFAQIAMQDPNTNRQYILRKLGKISRATKAELSLMFPQTIDELRADSENRKIENGNLPKIDFYDDDITHLEIHNKASSNKAKIAHIEAHKINMFVKKKRPELMPMPQEPGQKEMGGYSPVNTGGVQSAPRAMPNNQISQSNE